MIPTSTNSACFPVPSPLTSGQDQPLDLSIRSTSSSNSGITRVITTSVVTSRAVSVLMTVSSSVVTPYKGVEQPAQSPTEKSDGEQPEPSSRTENDVVAPDPSASGLSAPKKFLCTECGKCLSSQKDLTRHQRVHTGEKSFACSVCGKKFSRKDTCVIHQKSAHIIEKLFTCLECGKSYCYKSALSLHMRKHNGEKPYACSVCGKTFNDRGNCKRHEKKHAS